MRIHIGSDHAGFDLKESVRAHLETQGHQVTDVGAYSTDSVDYPDVAEKVALAVTGQDADLGVLVCGTGLGMAIAANKVRGVRAVQVSDPEFAKMSRAHNDANVLTLAGRYTEPARANEIVDTFLDTPFEAGRHQRRVDMMTRMENCE